MMKFGAAAIAALAVAALATPASAGVLDNVQIKIGVSGVLPNEDAKISAIGGNVDISDEYAPSAQIEYFFNDHISAELLCCVARHDVAAVNTSVGRVDLGQVTHFPPTLTVKYRWTDFGAFQPYLGAGVNYTHFFDAKLPAGPVTHIKYGDSFGPALQVGADYRLTDHWALNLDVRRIWIHTNADLTTVLGPVRAKVDIDPYVVTAAVGYRF